MSKQRSKVKSAVKLDSQVELAITSEKNRQIIIKQASSYKWMKTPPQRGNK